MAHVTVQITDDFSIKIPLASQRIEPDTMLPNYVNDTKSYEFDARTMGFKTSVAKEIEKYCSGLHYDDTDPEFNKMAKYLHIEESIDIQTLINMLKIPGPFVFYVSEHRFNGMDLYTCHMNHDFTINAYSQRHWNTSKISAMKGALLDFMSNNVDKTVTEINNNGGITILDVTPGCSGSYGSTPVRGKTGFIATVDKRIKMLSDVPITEQITFPNMNWTMTKSP